MGNITQDIDKFINDYGGNARDALNIALARIYLLEDKIKRIEIECNKLHETIGNLKYMTPWLPEDNTNDPYYEWPVPEDNDN